MITGYFRKLPLTYLFKGLLSPLGSIFCLDKDLFLKQDILEGLVLSEASKHMEKSATRKQSYTQCSS